MTPRNLASRRPGPEPRALRALAAAAVVALVVVAFALASLNGDGDKRAAEPLRFSYRVEPAGAAAGEETAHVLRARLAGAGVRDARVSVPAGASLTITAPAGARADVTALVVRGRVAIYDWERSVLGPRGAPAPSDPRVTGGADAGHAGALTKAAADARAAGRAGGRVVHAPADRRDWFVLGGTPALTDRHIERADSGIDPSSREPIVMMEFTAQGQTAFRALTRELARRGSQRAADGAGGAEAAQRLAIVIDDRIVAVPRIDFRQTPDGIDGASGAQIQGGLTPHTARQIAAILNSGPLPAALSTPSGPAPARRGA